MPARQQQRLHQLLPAPQLQMQQPAALRQVHLLVGHETSQALLCVISMSSQLVCGVLHLCCTAIAPVT